LAAQLRFDLKIDSRRIYAAGFSSGSSMVHRVAAELPDLIAGAAIVEGTVGAIQPDGSVLKIPTPKAPVAVLLINGKQDASVLYDGGQAPNLNALSVADSVQFWTDADQCTGIPTTTTSADGNIVIDDFTVCAAGSEVELITIVSGRHEWPSLNNVAHFAGTDAIWEFFSRHSLSQ
jgi:polyhydroxybutyrate depolymerase